MDCIVCFGFREETDGIKEGEIEKSKSYCAYCWCARDPTQEDLDKLTANKVCYLYFCFHLFI